ncbi:MAG: regulatory protein RecX [Bacteroidaceae bacterium]
MKELTEEQALAKVAALCSGAEKCAGQIRDKLSAWGVDEGKSNRIIAYLKQEKYIDDRRYCRAYCNDKMRYNHWGRIKIRQALRMQGLTQADIEHGLEALDEKEYEETLKMILAKKAKSLHKSDAYAMKQKLLRHAYSHGFEPELIFRFVDITEE